MLQGWGGVVELPEKYYGSIREKGSQMLLGSLSHNHTHHSFISSHYIPLTLIHRSLETRSPKQIERGCRQRQDLPQAAAAVVRWIQTLRSKYDDLKGHNAATLWEYIPIAIQPVLDLTSCVIC